MKPAPFPWRRAMTIGFGVLRLSSDAFWRMTPRELAAALDAPGMSAAPAMDRAGFEALRSRFPD